METIKKEYRISLIPGNLIPNNKTSIIGLTEYNELTNLNETHPINPYCKANDLIIISDTEIKEGDCCIKDWGIRQEIVQYHNDFGNTCKKIIATSSKSLSRPKSFQYGNMIMEDINGDGSYYFAKDTEIEFSKPRIYFINLGLLPYELHPSFVDEFIIQWNKGNKIEKVIVDYENYISVPMEHLLTGSDVEKECEKHPFLLPKTSKDGSIIVHFIKKRKNTKTERLKILEKLELGEITSKQDAQQLINLLKAAQKNKRSKEDIKETFEGAGIIDKNGNLKHPYKKIYFPSEK